MKTKNLLTTLTVVFTGVTIALAGDKDSLESKRMEMPATFINVVIAQAFAPDREDMAPDLTLATPTDLNQARNEPDELFTQEEPFQTAFSKMGE